MQASRKAAVLPQAHTGVWVCIHTRWVKTMPVVASDLGAGQSAGGSDGHSHSACAGRIDRETAKIAESVFINNFF